MRKVLMLLAFLVVLAGCSSSENKVLGTIQLGKTTLENLKELNLEEESYEVWNEESGIYEFIYIGHSADYRLNNVDGKIQILFDFSQNKTAKAVTFSAEATSENMKTLLSYLSDDYGKNYAEIEDYTTRWTSGDLTIDYVLTEENTVEIRWYTK